MCAAKRIVRFGGGGFMACSPLPWVFHAPLPLSDNDSEKNATPQAPKRLPHGPSLPKLALTKFNLPA